MTVSTNLSSATLSVEPGAGATAEVRLCNTGDLVDQFTVDVVGATAGWATVTPSAVNLMPGGEATVEVRFAPPRTWEVPAGSVPFAVRVLSREDPRGSAVVEGVLDVAPFTDLAAELVPTRKRGSRKAKYQLAVENLGNVATHTVVTGFDPEDDQLALEVRPAELDAAPGTVTIVTVRAVPARRLLRGEPKPHPFDLEVTGTAPVVETITVDGVMVQERLLPTWLLPMAIAFLVAAVALATLWFTVLVPEVESIATEQVAPQVSAAAEAASEASKAAAEASEAAEEATGGESGPAGGPDGGGADGGAADPGAPTGPEPVDFRIATEAEPVADGSYTPFTYTAPDGRPLRISDLVLQNPRGDSGLLRIVRGEDVLLEVGLANFRDLDYHYVNAVRVEPDQPVVVEVSCLTPGQGAAECTPAVSFSGQLLPPSA